MVIQNGEISLRNLFVDASKIVKELMERPEVDRNRGYIVEKLVSLKCNFASLSEHDSANRGVDYIRSIESDLDRLRGARAFDVRHID
jgi:hypothetical protein